VNSNFRHQVIIRTTSFGSTHEGLAHVLPGIDVPAGAYVEIDVDPVALL
jgi:hypothetical protein